MNDKNKIDILIVDDSSLALSLLEKQLAHYDLHIVYENDPNRALEIIENSIPKVIFIDYMMPDLTGIDVAIKFSELKLFKHCSINLLSAKDFNQTEVFSFMSLGYENILKKPISSEELERVLLSYFPNLIKKAA